MEWLRLSLHAEQRLQQRGIRPLDLALVMQPGTRVQDGFILRASDVAVEADTALSAYRPERVWRRKLLARAL